MTNDISPSILLCIPKGNYPHIPGNRLLDKLKKELNIPLEYGELQIIKAYICFPPFNNLPANIGNILADNILITNFILPNIPANLTIENRFYPQFKCAIIEGKKPGVTDDEGMIAQQALEMFLQTKQSTQKIFAQYMYLFAKELSRETLQNIAQKHLNNNLLFSHSFITKNSPLLFLNPQMQINHKPQVTTVNIQQDIQSLLKQSSEALWLFNLPELEAIQQHFSQATTILERQKNGLPSNPTDCEMEILAQSWSEHCKHKEFAAKITYRNFQTGKTEEINSLFQTYIRAATQQIKTNLEELGATWIVKVFDDNAGLVRISKNKLFAWKVETHNSPSALDPFGGALTGIVGVNRDIMGTGVGGAKLIFNTNVLCFGFPGKEYNLPPEVIPPEKILRGVCKGIEEGGNKSGIPTVNGAVVFQDAFRGKPLVFCGSGGIIPEFTLSQNNSKKNIQPRFLIFTAGGRVGIDGVHGATFSSVELTQGLPSSVVQIGSPFTQKNLADFLITANAQNLLAAATDNGAGGLSSSIGELAQISGGAKVWLEQVPLKYPGLQPWEIFLSESQERMTLVIEPKNAAKFIILAKHYNVEVAQIGEFTDSGFLDVFYQQELICHLNLNFLHNGNPQLALEAEYSEIILPEFPTEIPGLNYNTLCLNLLYSSNICSRETIIRRFDKEVQGKSVLKPLMGLSQNSPQDAAVLRLDFNSYEGIAVACGICPKFTEFGAYAASASAFDEGLRQIISVGGMLPTSANPEHVWSINDNFCVPDSNYHPHTNPDGKFKLGQLVEMCKALFDLTTYFSIPCTSGKDSMKNDFRIKEEKISIPPTVLFSFTAKIPDIRKIVDTSFKRPGDLIYLLGKTYFEMAGSELATLFKIKAGHSPKVRKEEAKELYLQMMQAHNHQLLASSHDLSDGGLLIALAECAFGGQVGVKIDLPPTNIPLLGILCSESNSRFLVSIKQEQKDIFESIFKNNYTYLGTVTSQPEISINFNNVNILKLPIIQAENAWKKGGELFL